jgi:uncharacterized protein YjiS (DUF1127 family)
MPSERKLRRFLRQWRKRYPYPLPWIDNRANRQCRRSEDSWLGQFEGLSTLKRRDVVTIALWRFGGDGELMEKSTSGLATPAEWGHARRCIKRALSTDSSSKAMKQLLGDEDGVPGWGLEFASAVLSVVRPSIFVVADPRALRSLRALGVYRSVSELEFASADWWPYLRSCRHLSRVSGLSLRDVGRALWAGADDAPGLPT